MSKWPGCPIIACQNDLCAERCQAGTDIVERLRHTYFPDPLTDEAAAEIEHLRRRLNEVDAQLTAEDHIHARENMALRAEKDAEIERLRLTPEEAYLQIVEGWLRDNRGIHFTEGAVDDLCKRIARALEPKP